MFSTGHTVPGQWCPWRRDGARSDGSKWPSSWPPRCPVAPAVSIPAIQISFADATKTASSKHIRSERSPFCLHSKYGAAFPGVQNGQGAETRFGERRTLRMKSRPFAPRGLCPLTLPSFVVGKPHVIPFIGDSWFAEDFQMLLRVRG